MWQKSVAVFFPTNSVSSLLIKILVAKISYLPLIQDDIDILNTFPVMWTCSGIDNVCSKKGWIDWISEKKIKNKKGLGIGITNRITIAQHISIYFNLVAF